VSAQDSGGGQVIQRFVQSGTADVPPDLAEQLKQMEANRKVVEYRMTYSDYRQVNGVMLPFRYARSIAGQPSDEITLSSLRTNVKIDPQKFAVVK
jgi:hypothetical protein